MPASPFACSPNPQPSSRRTRVPPALTRGPEAMPALGIIDEVSGDLGVVLWRSARDVALWAGTPPGRRGGLFAGPAAARRGEQLQGLRVDAELVAPLSVMARMLECPGGMDVVRLVHACRRISVWAEQRGMLATALEFLQAAAQAAPESAGLAYGVGRLARRRAEYDRAESWYGRAIVQARRSEDWAIYARAYSGVGNLFSQRGNYPSARRAYMRSLAAASRHGLDEIVGNAYHDLFLAAVETGTDSEAEGFADRAVAAYGDNPLPVARLAFDVAYQWILQGRFADALRVARAIAPHFEGSTERALVLSMIARTAGGAGEAETFRDAADRLRELLETAPGQDAAARALLGLAYGASSLGDWTLAQEYAEQALRVATERREGKIAIASEAALESIQGRSELQARCTPTPRASRLAGLFVAALEPRTAVPA